MSPVVRITFLAAAVAVAGLFYQGGVEAREMGPAHPCDGNSTIPVCLNGVMSCNMADPAQTCRDVLDWLGCPGGYVGQAHCSTDPGCNPYDVVVCQF